MDYRRILVLAALQLLASSVIAEGSEQPATAFSDAFQLTGRFVLGGQSGHEDVPPAGAPMGGDLGLGYTTPFGLYVGARAFSTFDLIPALVGPYGIALDYIVAYGGEVGYDLRLGPQVIVRPSFQVGRMHYSQEGNAGLLFEQSAATFDGVYFGAGLSFLVPIRPGLFFGGGLQYTTGFDAVPLSCVTTNGIFGFMF